MVEESLSYTYHPDKIIGRIDEQVPNSCVTNPSPKYGKKEPLDVMGIDIRTVVLYNLFQ